MPERGSRGDKELIFFAILLMLNLIFDVIHDVVHQHFYVRQIGLIRQSDISETTGFSYCSEGWIY